MFKKLILAVWVVLFFCSVSFALDLNTRPELGIATSSDGITTLDADGTPNEKTRRTLFSGTATDYLDGTGQWKSIGASDVEVDEIGTATYDDLQDYINNTNSAGLTTGGLITDSGSGQIDISALTGFIRPTASVNAALASFDLAGAVDQSLTDSSINYVQVDYNAGTPVFLIAASSTANGQTIFNLGKVYREGTGLDIINSGIRLSDWSKRSQQHHVEESMLHFTSGAKISEPANLKIAISAGVMYAGLNRITTPAIDTNVADTFEYYYLLNGVWTETDETDIDNLQYNDVTTPGSEVLANIANARYGIGWIYKGTGTKTYIVYGQDSYTLFAAQNATIPSSLPSHVEEMGTLRGKVIIAQAAASITEIEQVDDESFTASTPSNHNELAGINGGAAAEYFHLTTAEHTNLTGSSTIFEELSVTKTFTGLIAGIIDNPSAAAANVVGAAWEVMNDNDYWGLIGMTGSGSTISGGIYADTFHVYNQGYADTLYTVDGNKDHVWYTDPTDSHNFSFVEKMKLSADGSFELAAGAFTVDAAGDLISKDFAPTGAVDMTGSSSVNMGKLVFADAATLPSTVGELRYVNNATGFIDGLFGWYDDDAVRYLVDLDTLPTNDDYVVAYDADNDKYYMKADAGGAETNSLETTITGIADTEIFVGDGADSGTFVVLSGNATLANDGVATVSGLNVVTATKTSAYTIGTDDANEMFGGSVYVTTGAVITADAVATGQNFSVVTIGDIAVSLDVNASDKMYLDGVLLDDGDQATNTSKSGDTITCQYYSADGFYCWSGTVLGGHWTDGS